MSKTLFDLELEAMSTEELENVLRVELSQVTKDYGRIHNILEILRARKTKPNRSAVPCVTQDEVDRAYQIYQEAMPIPHQKPKPLWRMKAVAAVAAVLCLVLVALPVSGTPFIQEMVAKWNDNIFWIETPGTPVEPPEDYVFQTDNPGLQQLYDVVTELGINFPVVPMWLPDGYELSQIQKYSSPDNGRIVSTFENENSEIIICFERKDGIETDILKDIEEPEAWWFAGKKHFYVTNSSKTKVVWITDGYEIIILASLDKSVMHSIVNSIYHGKGI